MLTREVLEKRKAELTAELETARADLAHLHELERVYDGALQQIEWDLAQLVASSEAKEAKT